MQLLLPPGLSTRRFTRALAAFERVVGREWVLATDEDRETYLDIYAPGDDRAHAPAAAVCPSSTEEVQAIVRLANEHRVPLWPISRGKNFGYGGAAPAMPGTVVLDMTRMNRILEVDAKLGYCVIEPGVGFFDLHDHLERNGIPLWMGIPGNAWGSVIGNALERGFSSSPYGEHCSSLCGLEVVLPTGELVRTGTGAMSNSATWPLFKYGFGPSWDTLFVQSNFGIVTKAGMWLMPEPEATLSMNLRVPRPEDIAWLVDTLTPLRLQRVIEHNVGITSYMGSATMSSQRVEWYEGKDALPESVVKAIMDKTGAGWWNLSLRLYGLPEVNEAHRALIEKAIAPHPDVRIAVTRWRRGEPHNAAAAPRPSVFPLQIVNWHGGRGGHIAFSPVLPADGARVLEQLARTRQRYAEYGIDYSGTFYICGRHVINVNLMLYNRDDADLTERTRRLFRTLVSDAAAAGYCEYRTHLTYMDDVARTFDFNDHALLRLNEAVKDVLDPNGILAPGKSGIWPRHLRGQRT
ncbi:MAG TPA: FAD-binding oxidoreductase [Steroidobacteraceae bacterium]|nr:FAD-binding oxidoreductase [Steroidobacteraceae bacterium]